LVGGSIFVHFAKPTAFDLNANQLGGLFSRQHADAGFRRKPKLRQGLMKMENLARPRSNCRAQPSGQISLQVAKCETQ